jgi:DNA topoisomerase 2-associated protein PAT1
MLNFQKGIKLLPRALRYMATEQILAVYSLIFTRMECLDVCNTPLNRSRDEDEIFMNTIIPPFVDVIAVAGLDVINTVTRIFLERHNMTWVAKSRVGLALLTAILSRAEILKAGEGLNDQDVSLWFY